MRCRCPYFPKGIIAEEEYDMAVTSRTDNDVNKAPKILYKLQLIVLFISQSPPSVGD